MSGDVTGAVSEFGEKPGPPAVSLARYLHHVAKALAGPRRSAHLREFVLVDANRDVLAAYRNVERATEGLNVILDEDPALVTKLQLLMVEEGEVRLPWWPHRQSPVQRAGALAAQLARGHTMSDAKVEAAVRWRFLRGNVELAHLKGASCRTVELWWYTADGKPEVIGLLVEHEDESTWQLLLDGRACRIDPRNLYEHVAATLEDALGDDRWNADDIAAVDRSPHYDEPTPPTPWLGPAHLHVLGMLEFAKRLHITEPLGPDTT